MDVLCHSWRIVEKPTYVLVNSIWKRVLCRFIEMLEEGVTHEDSQPSTDGGDAVGGRLTASSSIAGWEAEDVADKHDQV
jgi:hypothetical protein